MRRAALGITGLLAGYVLGGLAGFVLVSVASPNMHDKSVEMAMTGAFVTGPMGAILGVATALLMSRRKVS